MVASIRFITLFDKRRAPRRKISYCSLEGPSTCPGMNYSIRRHHYTILPFTLGVRGGFNVPEFGGGGWGIVRGFRTLPGIYVASSCLLIKGFLFIFRSNIRRVGRHLRPPLITAPARRVILSRTTALCNSNKAYRQGLLQVLYHSCSNQW